MDVPIIGAGISGLSCARELERLGHKPVIFEKNVVAGDIFSYTSMILNFCSFGKDDFIKRIRKHFHLNIIPANTIKELVFHSEKNKVKIKGDLGYIFIRGAGQDSLESQLLHYVKAPVNYSKTVDINKLKGEYKKIVVASGSPEITSQLGCWKNKLNINLKAARILGDFKPDRIEIWFNKRYFKNGHGYLIPIDDKSATLGLYIPNLSQQEDISLYFSEFLYGERINNEIIETFEVSVGVGAAEPIQYNGIYFTGNAGGFWDPVFGVSQEAAIESGILAARCLDKDLNYSDSIKHLTKKLDKQMKIYETLEGFQNPDYDNLITYIKFSPVKRSLSKGHRNIFQAIPVIWPNASLRIKKQKDF